MESLTPPSLFLRARTQQEDFLRHFGFRESPFGVTPDPEFLFWSPRHSAALQAMIAAIESNLGFSVLLGTPGTGKTTLLFHLLAQYRESARTAFVFQTQCRPQDLIRHIASELELPVSRRDEVSLHHSLNGMLLKEARAGRKVLIIIDEAQNLQAPSLEAIRLLSDFETGPSKLLNVVLSGSSRLGETLMHPELSQLAQRILTICRLEPLTEQEVSDYVRFRLSVVSSGTAAGLFLPESLSEVASQSEGVPRIINAICYRALLLAYTQGHESITRKLVREAARDLDLSEAGNRDSRPALPFSEIPADTRSTGTVLSSVPAGNEQWRKRSVQAFVPVPLHDADETRPAQPKQNPPPVKNRDTNSRDKAGYTKADHGGRFRAPALIWFKNAGSYRHPSTVVIAMLVLLALGSWVGWSTFHSRPESSEMQLVGTQAEPSIPGAPPSKSDVSVGVALLRPGGPVESLANSNIRSSGSQPQKNQLQPLTDVSSNLVLPSKIHLPPSTPAEFQAPNTAVSVARNADGLARLATTVPPAPPRLEAEKTVTNASERVNSSSEPVQIIRPEYPVRARLAHIQGDVELELTIDQSGNVQKVRPLRGNPLLLLAAEQAVRQWKYPPSDQTTPPAVTWVKFEFKLDSEAKR
jgi:TonB family protein